MTVKEYLENLQSIQASILLYVDREYDVEENYENIIKIFDDIKIRDELQEVKLILRLISNISKHHYRSQGFFPKIEKLIQYFKTTLIKNFTSAEIHNLFKENNRIILFLIREKMIVIDRTHIPIYEHNFFQPEIEKYNYEQRKLRKEKEKNKKVEEEDKKVKVEVIKDKKEDPKEIKKYKRYILSDDSDVVYSDIESSDDFLIDEESYDEFSDSEEEDITNAKENIEEEEEEKEEEQIENDTNKYNYLKNYYKKKDDDDEIKEPIKPTEIYEEKRSIGENDCEICKIIREDLIEDFITYVTKNNIPLKSKIGSSDFETHPELYYPFLISLIDYAAFFGSVQIFKYLFLNGAKIDKTIWIYAIHGDNEEIIRILEDNDYKPENPLYLYEESVRCHNNDFARYIEKNYLKDENIKYMGLNYYNFELLTDDFRDVPLYLLIELEYYTLFKYLLDENIIKINNRITISDSRCPLGYFSDIQRYSTIEVETTPLIISIMLSKIDFVKLFLSQSDINVNLNSISKYNNFALFGDHKMDYDFIKEKSPLLIAYEYEKMDIVQLLLSIPDIDVNNKYIKKKIKGVIVDNKINPEDENSEVFVIKDKSLLSIAISYNDIEFLKLLLANPNVNVNIEDTKYIDSKKCSVKYNPLMKAIEKKNIEIIQLLLSNSKIDINCKFVRTLRNELITERTPLFSSMLLFEDDQIFDCLLSNPKIEINTIITKRTKKKKSFQSEQFYMNLLEKKNSERLSLLLSKPNIDVNIKTVNSKDVNQYFSLKTALYQAVKDKNIKIVTLLLSNSKIDVNFVSIKSICEDLFISKKSILYEAVVKGNRDIIRLLLENSNIDVNFKSLRIHRFCKIGYKKSMQTILFRAVTKGNEKIVQLLMKNPNIDVNETSLMSVSFDFDGNGDYIICKTPLHQAVLNEFVDIIKLLLNNKNINLDITDESKKKPIELTDNEEIISLIKNH